MVKLRGSLEVLSVFVQISSEFHYFLQVLTSKSLLLINAVAIPLGVVSSVGLKPVLADVAGPYVTAFYGIINTVGNTSGFLSSQVIGLIIDDNDVSNPDSWTGVFVIPCKFSYRQ